MLSEDLALVDGYSSYFSFSRRRSGYSGVATYVKTSSTPFHATEGLCGTLMNDQYFTQPQNGDKCVNEDISSSVIAAASSPLFGEWTKQTLREIDCEGRTVMTFHRTLWAPAHEPSDQDSLSSQPGILALINVYCPRADPARADRVQFKLAFYRALRLRAALLAQAGARVLIVGDLNTSHTVLDHCDPDEDFHLNPGRQFMNGFLITPEDVKEWSCSFLGHGRRDQIPKSEPLVFDGREASSGTDKPQTMDNHCFIPDQSGKDFVTVERHGETSLTSRTKDEAHENQSSCPNIGVNDHNSLEKGRPLDAVVQDGNYYSDPLMALKLYRDFRMIDTFRALYPNKRDVFSCWNVKANARETNYGTRIDYVLSDPLLFSQVSDSLVLCDIMGSDHCPVACHLKITVVPAEKLPQFCSKNFVEFQGEQQKLSTYFQRKETLPETQVEVDHQNWTKFGAKRKCDDVAVSENTESKRGTLSACSVSLDHKLKSQSSADMENEKFRIGVKKPTPYSSPSSKGRSSKNLLKRRESKNSYQSKLSSFFSANNTQVLPTNYDDSLPSLTSPSIKSKFCSQNLEYNPSEKSNPLSLYEAEMKYLQDNPDIYKKLNIDNDGDVNMDILSTVVKCNDVGNVPRPNKSAGADEGSFADALNMVEEIIDQSYFKAKQEKNITNCGIVKQISSTSNQLCEPLPIPKSPRPNAQNENLVATVNHNHSTLKTISYTSEHSSEVRNDSELSKTQVSANNGASDWSFMKQKAAIPLCSGHKEPCVMRTSKKKGVNFNRRFYACRRGAGRPGQKDAQCNFFKWI
ncbi:DNA-(apurinic or apyrimidinic site) endonuclease 2-like isoform X2 [Hyalella azteca]|nr:DNA-(apurinic or apyrimidinic site) endonuclease 2-like isoform X2 [Hyalella azteca]